MLPTVRRRVLGYSAGIVGPIILATILIHFRGAVAAPAVGLGLVLIITACATFGSIGAGVTASLTSSLTFDYGFTRPYGNFSITARNDVETTLLLFVIGAAVSALAARARRSDTLASARAQYLEMLHDFAEMVATGEKPEFVVIRAAAELSHLLDLKDCTFEPTKADGKIPRLEPGGDVYVANICWDVGELGLPGKVVELLVESHGHSRGRFLMVPTPGRPISLDRRILAVALADQVGAALTGRLRRED